LNVSEKATVLGARVPDNISKGGKGLIAHAALWQVEVEEALAFCTSCLGKRGPFVQSAQISSTEVDDIWQPNGESLRGGVQGLSYCAEFNHRQTQ
jgi:hypothetical protein